MQVLPASQASAYWSIPSGKGWERLGEIAVRVLKGLGLLLANIVTVGLIPGLRQEFKGVLFGKTDVISNPSPAEVETKPPGYYFFGDTEALKPLDGKEGCKLLSFGNEAIKEAADRAQKKEIIPVRVTRLALRLSGDDFFKTCAFETAFPNPLHVFLDFGGFSFVENAQKISDAILKERQVSIPAERILLIKTSQKGVEALENPQAFLDQLRALSR